MINNVKKYGYSYVFFFTIKSSELCIFIRSIFNEYRRDLASYFKNGATPLLWTFHPNIIFSRTDLFIRRLQIIEVCRCVY